MGNIIDTIRDSSGTTYDIHSGDVKSIVLELLPTSPIDRPNREDYYINIITSLRLHLVGFNESDIGSYIWLLRKATSSRTYGKGQNSSASRARRKTIRKKGFKHPTTWNSEVTNISKVGYGVLAGKQMSWGEYQEVPNWMPHNGFIPTEWEITQEHISQGYMDIDIGTDFVCMLKPDYLYNEHIIFDTDHDIETFGGRQYFKYCQVKDNKIICYSNEILKFQRQQKDDWTSDQGNIILLNNVAPIIDENNNRRISNLIMLKLI